MAYDFTHGALPADFQWLRHPHPERLFRTSSQGLRLIGRESIGSWFEQALVARRQEDFAYQATTVLDFDPEHYQQAAGLTTYYNRFKFHALMLTNEPGNNDTPGAILVAEGVIGVDDVIITADPE